jgi:4-amino-4-deoxy-L-arabinose transferase-like glycosyltransferase
MSAITFPEPTTAPVEMPPPESVPPEQHPDGASPTSTSPVDAGRRARLARLVRGSTDDPAWVRPSLLGLLVATGVLYMWGLGASGWANSFYSAAVQAGTKSWKAFFFGSSDASNFITVDKPPAALWVMDLSARIFGVNSWSILVPQALEGVAAVGLLYAAVRRWFSPAAGLIAGAVLATTPVAALMFRFNNPDALLVLLLVAGAYAMVRALEVASTKWLLLAAAYVGFGFLTKMLQALLVVPAFAIVYLLAAPTSLRRRLLQLVGAAGALLVSAGWWVAVVEIWPTSSRPYIGGSQNNSVLDLIFGYNGFGRLTGNESGSVVGGGRQPGGGQWGPTGWYRMFNSEFGSQASWLLPTALVLLVAGLAYSLLRPRTDRLRASMILWGGWLIVTAATFSLGQGIIHPYYTVALGPAIGAIVGIVGTVLWKRRHELLARIVLAGAIVVTVWWARELLSRSSQWHPWVSALVLVAGIVAAIALVVGPSLPAGSARRWTARAVVAGAAIAAFAGPFGYSVATAATTHAGALPTAGPSATGGFRFGTGGPRPINGGFNPGNGGGQFPNGGRVPGGGQTGQLPVFPGAGGIITGGGNGNGGFGGGPSRVGGLLTGSKPDAELVAALEQDADQYRWVAATIGANNASGYQLGSGDAVMAIGGFNGTDPTPTLAQFEQYVENGDIHYFIPGGTGGSSTSSGEISDWVQANFTSTTIGGVTLYDLTSPA